MRFTSHECRWFFRGSLDPEKSNEVVERFKTAGGWKKNAKIVEPRWPGEWREDRYEFLGKGVEPQRVDFGIKIRDERPYGKPLKIEYKARTSSFGPVRLAPRATGIVERWMKWSYEEETVPAALWRPFEAGEMGTLLRKKRMLRKIRLDAFDNDEEIPVEGPGSYVDRGLSIELTRILLDNREEHWTIGFEAFPHDTEMHEDFFRNAEVFLTDFADVADLAQTNSMSYPEWLCALKGSSG